MCNLCLNNKKYKGSYTRVKAHTLYEGVKGVDVCSETRTSEARARYKRELDNAQRLKEQRAKLSMVGASNTCLGTSSSKEPRIVHEARKRRALELKAEMENPTQDSRL